MGNGYRHDLHGLNEQASEVDLKLVFSHPTAEPYRLRYIDLEDAIAAEARTIADDAGSDLLDDPSVVARDELAASIVADATAVLWEAGDTYTDPTGVRWTLEEDND